MSSSFGYNQDVMVSQSAKRTHLSAWATVALVLLVLVVLYVLSIGPVIAIAYGSMDNSLIDAAHTLYTPLVVVTRDTPLEGPLNTYVDWWCDRLGAKMIKIPY